MTPFRAVLFDFFGTLTTAVRRGPRHAVIAQMLGSDLETLTTVLDRTYYTRASGMFGSAEADLRFVCDRMGTRPSDDTLRDALAARTDALRAETRLRADAAAALRAVRDRGLRTALVSDCTYELAAYVPHLPVATLLDTLVFSTEVGECKPAARMYLTACERLDVAPEECLYVGDGGSRELTGATEVGMTAVRLAAPDLHQHLTFNADAGWTGPIVASLTDAVTMVDPGLRRHPPRVGPTLPARGCDRSPVTVTVRERTPVRQDAGRD
ncbi:HAD family hydrolase [Polymorphospora lycopeni]|uniref:HAD-IA family hydrolase n=1 Tax=Polymorphospora lycopeni TaxID=3140240 RepID=A0ABV5CT26_9ACTN